MTAVGSVHLAELGTTLVVGASTGAFGNVDWRMGGRWLGPDRADAARVRVVTAQGGRSVDHQRAACRHGEFGFLVEDHRADERRRTLVREFEINGSGGGGDLPDHRRRVAAVSWSSPLRRTGGRPRAGASTDRVGRRYRGRDDAGGRPRPGDALPGPGPRHGLPGQGVPAGPRRRAQHRPGRDRRAGRRRHADQARRHRRLQRQGDHRGAGRRGAALPGEAGGDDPGADHAGRPALPRRAARRLPPALDVERRRRRDRGDGGDRDRRSATSTWC